MTSLLKASPDLVVLDFDGTLVDLAVDWPNLRTMLAKRIGRPVPRVLEVLQALRDEGDLEAVAAAEAVVVPAEVAGSRVGAVNAALVDWLAREVPNVPRAVLTLNSAAAVAAAPDDLPRSFTDVVARGDVSRPKPDPEGLQLILRRFGVDRRRALLIGDSSADLGCAAAAGVPALHVDQVGVIWVRPSVG